MNIEELLSKAKKSNYIICVYGLGKLGQRLYNEIPSIYGLKADIYSDGDDKKVDAISLEGIKGVHVEELIKISVETVVFVLVDDPYDIDIKNNLSVNKKLHIVTLRELAEDDIVIRYYYGVDCMKEFSNIFVSEGDEQ